MNQPPFRPDASLRLSHLHVLYYGLAMAYLEAAGAIPLEVATEGIPAQVYDLCVRANWMEHPHPDWTEKDGQPVELGEYLVPAWFKHAWAEEFGGAIDGIRAATTPKEDHPKPNRNPREWIEYFKSLDPKGRWSDEEIGVRVGLDTQTIVRYKSGTNGHPANLRKLAEFFIKIYPNEFKHFDWADLRWPKTPA